MPKRGGVRISSGGSLNSKTSPWRVLDLPLLDYREALNLQHRIAAARIEGTLPFNVVVVLEHPAVFTLGRRGGRENLTVSENFLRESAVGLVQTERGGNITYHGPGQLVAYPIVDLGGARIRVVDFVHGLEGAMIRTAARFGVTAVRDDRNRGVWVGGCKLGSVGLCVRRGVSFHGLALNVNLDLTPFSWIHPCGLANISMTSLSRECGREVSMADSRSSLVQALEKVFAIATHRLSIDALCRWLPPPSKPSAQSDAATAIGAEGSRP